MTSTSQEQLAELQRELARQDADWAETKQQLQELGDGPIPVPLEILEKLAEAASAPVPNPPRHYLVRG
jgi:cell division protein FtsB